MEITGKIIVALEPRSGVSNNTGNPWKMQSFVLETTTEQYPRRCVFDVFGEDRLNQFNIQVGQEYTVSFDIDAREYQGRWFNSIRAWRVAAPQSMGAPAYGAPAACLMVVFLLLLLLHPKVVSLSLLLELVNFGQAPTGT